MTLGIVVGLLIVLLVAAWALRPLVAARRLRLAPAAAEESLAFENLLFQRESLLEALRDLQMDQAMGKLSAEDFATLDASYRAQAIAVLQQLDTLGAGEAEEATDALDLWIEQAVAAARGEVRVLADRPVDFGLPTAE